MKKFDQLINEIKGEIEGVGIGDIRIFVKKDKKYGQQLEQGNPFTVNEILGNGGEVYITYNDSGRFTGIPGQVIFDKSRLIGKDETMKAVKKAGGGWIGVKK